MLTVKSEKKNQTKSSEILIAQPIHFSRKWNEHIEKGLQVTADETGSPPFKKGHSVARVHLNVHVTSKHRHRLHCN